MRPTASKPTTACRIQPLAVRPPWCACVLITGRRASIYPAVDTLGGRYFGNRGFGIYEHCNCCFFFGIFGFFWCIGSQIFACWFFWYVAYALGHSFLDVHSDCVNRRYKWILWYWYRQDNTNDGGKSDCKTKSVHLCAFQRRDLQYRCLLDIVRGGDCTWKISQPFNIVSPAYL